MSRAAALLIVFLAIGRLEAVFLVYQAGIDKFNGG